MYLLNYYLKLTYLSLKVFKVMVQEVFSSYKELLKLFKLGHYLASNFNHLVKLNHYLS